MARIPGSTSAPMNDARLPLRDAVQLAPTALTELRALADDARDLHAFDRLVPTITALGEVELLVLIGMFVASESVHQAFHAAGIYRFGNSEKP